MSCKTVIGFSGIQLDEGEDKVFSCLCTSLGLNKKDVIARLIQEWNRKQEAYDRMFLALNPHLKPKQPTS